MEWSKFALPSTTLWFWNSEQGWATTHNLIEDHGWEFRNCHVWDKGNGHIAGNANTKTLRKFPVVTEVCVQYTRRVTLPSQNGTLPLRDWLRYEWERTGLPFSKTNEACGVVNAATRKYFTKDHLWYFPPAEAFDRLVRYANSYGRFEGRPYFSIDGRQPLSSRRWAELRAKFHCGYGIHNVWREPPVRGEERIKNGARPLHANQKPLVLMRRIIEASSDPGDVVWEPFGGTCSGAVAALRTGRRAYAAEIDRHYYDIAIARILEETGK